MAEKDLAGVVVKKPFPEILPGGAVIRFGGVRYRQGKLPLLSRTPAEVAQKDALSRNEKPTIREISRGQIGEFDKEMIALALNLGAKRETVHRSNPKESVIPLSQRKTESRRSPSPFDNDGRVIRIAGSGSKGLKIGPSIFDSEVIIPSTS
jgi:hypothetical protein